MTIRFDLNRSYAPVHPGAVSLSEDPKVNANITCIYSHCGEQLSLNEKGVLFVPGKEALKTSPIINSSTFDFLKSLSASFDHFGLNANKKATLFDVKARDVRQCVVQTMNSAVEMMRKKVNNSTDVPKELERAFDFSYLHGLEHTYEAIMDSLKGDIIGLLDTDPLISSIPKEIRKALEILYQDGVTPYTYEPLNELLKGDIESLNLSEYIKNDLLELKKALASFEWYKPMQEFQEVQDCPIDSDTLKSWFKIILSIYNDETVNKSIRSFLIGFGDLHLRKHRKDRAPCTSEVLSPEQNAILEKTKKKLEKYETKHRSIEVDPYPEINALLNIDFDKLKDLSSKALTVLRDLKNTIPTQRSTRTYVEILEMEVSNTFNEEKEFRPLNRRVWLYTCKKIKKYAEIDSSSLQSRYAHQLFAPWYDINKWTIRFIDNESTRSFMDDPACRWVTGEDFIMKLTNLFLWNGVNMRENFPELADCYNELKKICGLNVGFCEKG